MSRSAFAVSIALLLWVSSASAQLALPVTAPPLVFSTTVDEASYVIDLSTMPTRPVLVAEGTPDSSHPDLVLELRLENYDLLNGPFLEGEGFSCPEAADVRTSPAVPGPNAVREDFWECDPSTFAWAEKTVEVFVRVADFGASGPPASVDVVIRGETRVPTNTLLVPFSPNPAQQTVTLLPSKDTTLYQADPSGGNGAGQYLWAATDADFPPEGGVVQNELRALIAFDLLGPVPGTAQIDDVDLVLDDVEDIGGNIVELYRVADDLGVPPIAWPEGDADSGGDEFLAATSAVPAATWSSRESPSIPWASAGGDPTGPPLDVQSGGPGDLWTFSSTALAAAVEEMVSTGRDGDGFLLRLDQPWFFDAGVRFASRENTQFSERPPEMIVRFTPRDPYQEGDVEPGVLEFIDEGDDFRWIYDLDDDGIFTTEIGGVCTELGPSEDFGFLEVPYTYQYTGNPGYVGLDCCTWQIDSPETGTLGTGQAIFFHGLDPLNPANLPPDFDGDGIFDGCDNCFYTPNGPNLGTCLAGPSQGQPCHSEAECVGGGCSLSQQDGDGDFRGDACAAPEPGFGLTLTVGSLLAARLGRRSRRRSERRAAAAAGSPGASR